MRKLLLSPSGSAEKGITLGEGVPVPIPWWPLVRRDSWRWLHLLWLGSSLAAAMLNSLPGAGNGAAAVAGSGEGVAAQLPRSKAGR